MEITAGGGTSHLLLDTQVRVIEPLVYHRSGARGSCGRVRGLDCIQIGDPVRDALRIQVHPIRATEGDDNLIVVGIVGGKAKSGLLWRERQRERDSATTRIEWNRHGSCLFTGHNLQIQEQWKQTHTNQGDHHHSSKPTHNDTNTNCTQIAHKHKNTNTNTNKKTQTQEHKHKNTKTHKHKNTHTNTNTQTHKHTNTNTQTQHSQQTQTHKQQTEKQNKEKEIKKYT